MQANSDLKRLERRALLTFFQDGLWDICLGLFIIAWGIGILLDLAFLVGGWFIVFWLMVLGLKKWITYPRIGYVRMDQRELKIKARIALLLGVVAVLGVFFLVLFGIGERPAWLSDYFAFIFSAMLSLIVAVVGEWLGIRRFLIYAALIFCAGAVQQWTEIAWSYAFIVAGSMISCIGFAILVKFIRDNPKPSGGIDFSG